MVILGKKPASELLAQFGVPSLARSLQRPKCLLGTDDHDDTTTSGHQQSHKRSDAESVGQLPESQPQQPRLNKQPGGYGPIYRIIYHPYI